MDKLIRIVAIITLIASVSAVINGCFCFVIYILDTHGFYSYFPPSELIVIFMSLQFILFFVIVVFMGLLQSLNILNRKNRN